MKRFYAQATVLLTLILGTSALAQDKQALVGGTLINGLGGSPIYDSVILINGDMIEKVGSVDTLEVPDDYTVVSTEAMSVLPGLWDMHVHLMLTGHADYSQWHPNYADRFAPEIMPASALQLLLAGVTSARDLGAPLEDTLAVKRKLEAGEIYGPRMFWSGPFIQKAPYPGTEDYRWGISGVDDAREKVRTLANAGMDVIKLIDHDLMTVAEGKAIVDEAHKYNLPVVAHAHRPPEIRRGLEIGIDNFEHTGLATAPEYPEDVMTMLKERTAASMIVDDPLYWTPTVEGLWNSVDIRENNEKLDGDCWHLGLEQDTVDDIAQSIAHPESLTYTLLHPKRQKTLKRKIEQLVESGAILMVGTDSGIPMKFHCQSTWNELDVWVRVMNIPPMEAIQAATYWPAKFMGVDDRWGTVTPGKFADIIAVKGDVLKHINLLQRVDFVMQGGQIFKQDGRVNKDVLLNY